MTHPALQPGGVAVITGGASGIGLAAAQAFARLGMRVCLVDVKPEALEAAERQVRELGHAEVMSRALDVADLGQLEALKAGVYDRFGRVDVLMNNAGISGGGTGAWDAYDRWRRVLEVNLWGVVNGVQAFVPSMLAQNAPALIINTGSKQGITNPPGDVAYNVSKSGVKTFTEALAHQLRNQPGAQISAHLLIPGFTFTGISRASEKPPGAWTPEQVVEFMIEGINRGDFYILCPDNEVTRQIDEKRIRWAADDLVRNRPALSRWRPDYKAEFDAFMAQDSDRQEP